MPIPRTRRRAAMLSAIVPILLAGCTTDGAGPVASASRAAPATATAGPAARPRNVILFIGDGMGVSTVTAARIYDGQANGQPGEENLLSFERFPNVALVKTYNTDAQVPDSAGTASAINSGVKTRSGVINTGPAAHVGDCAEGRANLLPIAAEQLHARGKAIGIVSTARLTHATPAAVYAHSPERDWENDTQLPAAERAAGCTDIASQLIGFPFAVALGGGQAQFVGARQGGKRGDAAADLPGAWATRTGGSYVTTAAGLQAAPAGHPVLGLFSPDHMTYALDRTGATAEPTLAQMAVAAVDRLAAEPHGYYLMVEAGRIDHAHHEGRAGYALAETRELSRAVAAVLDRVDLADTLVMVTADHSHVFTIAGYPTRGNPILGLVVGNDARGDPATTPTLAADGKPYTTLGYANGPGAVRGARGMPATGPGAVQQAAIPMGGETHAGEDVPLYATGAGAAAAHGVMEQNRIYDLIVNQR